MTSIRFRLIKVGDPAMPAIALRAWEEENGSVALSDGEFSDVLPVASIDDLDKDTLPEWLLRQDAPLEILPVQVAYGETRPDAWLQIHHASSDHEAPQRRAA